MTLKKAELVKVWKQLDGALEAIERIEEGTELNTSSVDSSAIVNLKNKVEDLIRQKERKVKIELK